MRFCKPGPDRLRSRCAGCRPMPHKVVSCQGEETSMSTALRWTSADLAVLPDDGKRYEIIDGELYISRQPHWHHQQACVKLCAALEAWSTQTGAGEANLAPGVIFAEDDDVAP